MTFRLGDPDLLVEELGDFEVVSVSFTSSLTDSDATFAVSLALFNDFFLRNWECNTIKKIV